MQLHDLRQLHDRYDHVYLSPHIDDAALSCGGAIARHIAGGQRVLVVTLCTAIPDEKQLLTPFAMEQHERWGMPGGEAMKLRLREDTVAMERLGADSFWAGFLDAIYRVPSRYNSEEALFGALATDDPLPAALSELLQALLNRLGDASIYAPLGVGEHVDHQIVCTAALELLKHGGAVAFYEDIPYLMRAGALERRLQALGGNFAPSVIDIEATLARKLGVIESYSSQLGVLFGSAEAMSAQISACAEQLRRENGVLGERLWVRISQ